MFQQNLTTNLLGIANVFVDKIENYSFSIQIYLSTPKKPQVCPCCGQTTKYIHDYRIQKIRDILFKVKKPFCIYINAVTFVNPVENDSLKSTTFFRGIDILQVEFTLLL